MPMGAPGWPESIHCFMVSDINLESQVGISRESLRNVFQRTKIITVTAVFEAERTHTRFEGSIDLILR